MRPSIAQIVRELRDYLGAGPAGKFLQRLLALAFVKAGLNVSDERTVEGPDIDVEGHQVEAKTTERDMFTLEEKDIEDMRRAERRGKWPAVALLRIGTFDGWIIANASGLAERTVRRRDLALRRVPTLERAANTHFESVVEAWAPRILADADNAFEEMGQQLRRQDRTAT